MKTRRRGPELPTQTAEPVWAGWIVTANHPGCNGNDGFPHYHLAGSQAEAEEWARNTYGAAGMTTKIVYTELHAPLKFPKVKP